MIIGVQQRPEVSDHDFVEEQERNLQSLCIRTMALPVGRGAMAFQCAAPLPTEPVSFKLITCCACNGHRKSTNPFWEFF